MNRGLVKKFRFLWLFGFLQDWIKLSVFLDIGFGLVLLGYWRLSDTNIRWDHRACKRSMVIGDIKLLNWKI